MGVYLVSVGAREWSDGSEDGRGSLAVALNEELRRRGLPPYGSPPEEEDFVRGSGQSFEEKLVPGMDGFLALCRAHLSQEETDRLCGWSLLVPFSLDQELILPVGDAYADETAVCGAPQVEALAQRLATAVALPPEVPSACDNLDLTNWFLDGDATKLAAVRPGPWSEDLDASFYVALYLRAAQHSVRRGAPIAFC
ncbi:hypothetical protein [Streptomyces naganishii]|uniref:Uncharacterized protein n=1 Tax=Streptomyces naganishii JCM 4654 TaxID=1306179 RepID=A0A918Y1T0_9ACTN|nr:hypothetical protein [Streptomyces naganishii]GHD88210.1 hypothetical protein GCM10010508_23330 [Streptomyces naganishii JCM 4654]